jgi:hypothetical protein
VRDSIEIYVNQMETKLNDLLNLKYNVNLVEYDDVEGVYRLIQKKNSIYDLEDIYIAPVINNFNYGEIYTGKTSSKKKKPVKKLKILGEDEEEEENNKMNIVQPNYNEDGTISWEDQNYQNVWNRFSIPYKKALMEDKDWLLETMNEYVDNTKQNKPLIFVKPNNLIIPPQILEDGSYDFGNKTYNDIFNKYDKSYQNTLLTLYTEKNGVRNYDMLIDGINTLLKQELGVTI